MKSHLSKYLLVSLILLMVTLSACNLLAGPAPTQISPNILYTAAAVTVQAQLTQQAALQPVPSATATQQPAQPSSTLAPTNTSVPPTPLPPTNTAIPPTATNVPIPCDRGSFVKDITFPDNTEVAAGTTFIKTWRIMNNGSCTWNSSYSLVFDSGESMGGPASLQLTTGTVAPGQSIDVSVTLTAPGTPKTYQGYWKLQNGAGVVFGIGDSATSAFWVKIKVISPVTPTPRATTTPEPSGVFDFIVKGPLATWKNATKVLSWGDPAIDSNGIAMGLDAFKLEDGATYDHVLLTYPQYIPSGVINGVYPFYTVQNGDHFRASIGFSSECTGAKGAFQVKYRVGNTDTILGNWYLFEDGKLNPVDLDLSLINGMTVQFMLQAIADGSTQGYCFVWLNPRVGK